MSFDFYFHVKDGCAHRGAKEFLVALVVRVSHESNARRQQFRARGVDDDIALTVGAVERELVVGAGSFAVLKFGLCHRGTERDVPQRGCFALVGLTASQVAQERAL
ncbi:unannotated protein [freshwater metagenome]|uniref:Unannotated protein n=1 Tax=freshwater metagenome TaxID=449393 RepID=A0A6J6XMY9_9ZZZZ